MGAIGDGSGLQSIVIPKFPYSPLPARITNAFPELEEWNRKHHEQVEKWRADTNAILTGKTDNPT